MRGGCIWSEFSGQNYTVILMIFPWKKTAGASLAPVTEALAGLQTRDTLKSRAQHTALTTSSYPLQHQTPSPCCRLFQIATTHCPHVFSLCFPTQIYKDLPFQTTRSSFTAPSHLRNGVCCWLSNNTPPCAYPIPAA